MHQARLLIIGGGRWAQVLVTAALEIGVPADRLGVVSPRHADGMRHWAAGDRRTRGVEVWDQLDRALSAQPWLGAVVANLPAEHAATARRLLTAGIAVLVEKPVCATVAEWTELVGLAAERGRLFAVGHELLYLEDAECLSRELQASGAPVELWWHENPSKHRDGSARTPDLTIGPVQDYLPHLLSVLGRAGGLAGAEVTEVGLGTDGVVTVELTGPQLAAQLTVSRTGGPYRGLAFTGPAGRIEVDLATDPPRRVDPARPGGEPRGRRPERPLQRELAAFLQAAADPDTASELVNSGARAGDVVRVTAEAQSRLDERRDEAMAVQLRAGRNAPLPAAVLDGIREDLAGPLLERGLLESVKDLTGLDHWATAAWRVVERLADDAFARAVDLAASVGATPAEYSTLCDVVAGWDAGQRVIMTAGRARKYWTNTIAPILSSGAMTSALRREPTFPLRVGVYPGLSCMFHCSFCGRVPDVRYDHASADPGFDRFVEMFESAPDGDPHRFYLSGGLEPLTNPRIGDIVHAGASRGFRLSMYSNALMLTPVLLRRQPGLWELDVLRVSLYGVDPESARAVTGHPRSYDKVIENVVTFLQLREEGGSDIRVGFNHVIVGSRADVVDELGALVADVQRRAGTRRGIDFLTLREDYSAIDEGGLSMRQRESMRAALARLQRQCEPGGLTPGLVVDLGYALDPLLHGWPARDLQFATEQHLRPALHAQVSVAVDVLGDVYAYREAAFPERPGGSRYIIGRLDGSNTLYDVVSDWVASDRRVAVHSGDLGMLDIFDHVVTLVLDGAARDADEGYPPERGPVRAWRRAMVAGAGQPAQLAHPFPVAPGTAGSVLAHPFPAPAGSVTAP